MTGRGWRGPRDRRCNMRRRGHVPWRRILPLGIVGDWRGVPRDCAVRSLERELSYSEESWAISVGCGRGVHAAASCERLRGGRVGRALHGAGAEGGPRSASTMWEHQA